MRDTDRIKDERVGAAFLHRLTRDDIGYRATVRCLDPHDPARRVLVDYEPNPGREPTSFDFPNLGPVSVAWLW